MSVRKIRGIINKNYFTNSAPSVPVKYLITLTSLLLLISISILVKMPGKPLSADKPAALKTSSDTEDIQGEGVTLTLTFDKADPRSGKPSPYLDSEEIYNIIRGIYLAGPCALSINDNIITKYTMIKDGQDGRSIMINNQRVSTERNIEIKAVGNSYQLSRVITLSNLCYKNLLSYKNELKAENSITIKKAAETGSENKAENPEFIYPPFGFNLNWYFSLGKNHYSGGPDNKGFTLELIGVRGGRLIIKQTNPSTTVYKKYNYTNDGRIILEYVGEHPDANYDVSQALPNTDETVLKLMIKKGNSWIGADKKIFEISDVDVQVKTPSGIFNSIEVTSTLNNMEEKIYYAPGLGPVKFITKVDGKVVSNSELTDYLRIMN